MFKKHEQQPIGNGYTLYCCSCSTSISPRFYLTKNILAHILELFEHMLCSPIRPIVRTKELRPGCFSIRYHENIVDPNLETC